MHSEHRLNLCSFPSALMAMILYSPLLFRLGRDWKKIEEHVRTKTTIRVTSTSAFMKSLTKCVWLLAFWGCLRRVLFPRAG